MTYNVYLPYMVYCVHCTRTFTFISKMISFSRILTSHSFGRSLNADNSYHALCDFSQTLATHFWFDKV